MESIVRDMKTIGMVVRSLRRQRGITLEALAHEAGMDAGNLSKFERGAQGTSDAKIAKIAKFLGMTLSELVKLAEDLTDGEQNEPQAADKEAAAPPAGAEEQPEKPRAPIYLKVIPVPIISAGDVAVIDSPTKLESYKPAHYLHAAGVSPKSFAMLVRDDTMTAAPGAPATYPQGHYVIFDPTLQHESHDCALVRLGPAQYTFTCLAELNGVWMMTPLNHRYPPRELPMNARVLAVAVGVQAITKQRR